MLSKKDPAESFLQVPTSHTVNVKTNIWLGLEKEYGLGLDIPCYRDKQKLFL